MNWIYAGDRPLDPPESDIECPNCEAEFDIGREPEIVCPGCSYAFHQDEPEDL